jgi:hypothetical protein
MRPAGSRLPVIEHFGEAFLGQRWAEGFLLGLSLCRETWERTFFHEAAVGKL